MTNNCYVKKLIGVENSADLPVYGAYKIHVKLSSVPSTNTDRCIKLYNGEEVKVKVVGTGSFSVLNDQQAYVVQNVTEATLATGWRYIECNVGEYDLEIAGKYKNYQIVITASSINNSPFSNINLSDLNYYLRNVSVKAKEMYGTYSPVDNLVNTISIESGDVSGIAVDLEAVKKLYNLSSFAIPNIKNVNGDIATVFGNKKQLSNLNIANSNVIGDVLQLAAAQVEAGRTSGAILISAFGTAVTVGSKNVEDYVHDEGGTYYVRIRFNSGVTGGYTLEVA